MYRLVEENKLRKLIEGNLIYEELSACGVDNWVDWSEAHFLPDINDIEKELNEFDKFEERDSDD